MSANTIPVFTDIHCFLCNAVFAGLFAMPFVRFFAASVSGAFYLASRYHTLPIAPKCFCHNKSCDRRWIPSAQGRFAGRPVFPTDQGGIT